MTDFSSKATIHHSLASCQHSAETVFVEMCVCLPVCNTAGGISFHYAKNISHTAILSLLLLH